MLASTARADVTVLLGDAKGSVQIRPPGAKSYEAAKQGTSLANGTRLKTGAKSKARLDYPDGSKAEVRPDSELIVRVSNNPKTQPNGAVLFLGRIWSKVAKSASGDRKFEVRSANAVAGVRGTEFETGVALDGAAMVRVSEGEVAVSDDEGKDVGVRGGYSVVSSDSGRLGQVGRGQRGFRWEGWLTKHAKKMEKRGLDVARSLDGRLNRRKAKVESLLAEAKRIRQDIQALEKRKKSGDDVDDEVRAAFAALRKVTARIEDMRARLEGAFGLFERWGDVASGGGIADADKIAGMAGNVAKIAADFADMIEEGTDLSEEGMNDLMKDMGEGKKMGPGDNAADELFK